MKWNIVKPAVKNYENSKTISLDWCDYYHNTMGKVSFIFNILGMKSIAQLAKEINVPSHEIYRIVKRDQLSTTKRQNNISLTQEQQVYITRVMFFERKTDYITYESKMNVKETFDEFKERTYTRLK